MSDKSESLTVRDAPVGLFKLHDGGEVISISEYSSKVNGVYFRDAYITSSGEAYHGGDDKTGDFIDLKQITEKLQAEREKVALLQEAVNLLDAWGEYFSAIEKGEYETNGRAKRIRTFEKILLNSGSTIKEKLKEREGKNEVKD